jgi:hypothetical protein
VRNIPIIVCLNKMDSKLIADPTYRYSTVGSQICVWLCVSVYFYLFVSFYFYQLIFTDFFFVASLILRLLGSIFFE